MTTLEQKTIYPRLKESLSAQDLTRVYTPTPDEHAWAIEITDQSDTTATLGCLIFLKTFQRLGYFVPIHMVPDRIIEHIATNCGLTAAMVHLGAYQESGSPSRHQDAIRALREVTAYRVGGKAIVERAVADAAIHHEDLAALINIAIETLIARRYELPGFTTLVKIAQRQRTATYKTWYSRIEAGLSPALRGQLDVLLRVDPTTQRSGWDTLKDPAGQPTRTNLTQLANRLEYLATFTPAIHLALIIPEAKRDHFADQAWAYNRAVMQDMTPGRRYTVMCSWLQHLQGTLLDELTESLIKVLRGVQHDAEEALATYLKQHQRRTDTLVTTLRDVVRGYQDFTDPTERFTAIETVLRGRDDQLLQDCDAHLTYAGNNWAPFVWGAYKAQRAQVLRILRLLPIHALSSDRRLEQALTFVLDHAQQKRMWLSVMKKEWVNALLYKEIPDLDLSWLPVGWWRLVTDVSSRTFTPHQVHRQHFEACVMIQVLAALNTGDLCVRDANRYGDPLARLYSWDEYHARIGAYGAKLGMTVDPAAFVAEQRRWLTDLCQTTDAGFPTNDQVVTKKGRISLRRRRRRPAPPGLAIIERAMEVLMPPRSILHALLTTDHWINWTRFFGPISGLDAKIDEPAAKYVATVFCYGSQIGPSAMARALGTMDRRQLARLDQVHISESALDQANQAIIQAYQRCPLPHLWGPKIMLRSMAPNGNSINTACYLNNIFAMGAMAGLACISCPAPILRS